MSLDTVLGAVKADGIELELGPINVLPPLSATPNADTGDIDLGLLASSAPNEGDVLTFTGGQWVPAAASGGGGIAAQSIAAAGFAYYAAQATPVTNHSAFFNVNTASFLGDPLFTRGANGELVYAGADPLTLKFIACAALLGDNVSTYTVRMSIDLLRAAVSDAIGVTTPGAGESSSSLPSTSGQPAFFTFSRTIDLLTGDTIQPTVAVTGGTYGGLYVGDLSLIAVAP